MSGYLGAGGPAEKLGVQAGWTVLAVDGQAVGGSSQQLQALMDAAKAATTMDFVFETSRGGSSKRR